MDEIQMIAPNKDLGYTITRQYTLATNNKTI